MMMMMMLLGGCLVVGLIMFNFGFPAIVFIIHL